MIVHECDIWTWLCRCSSPKTTLCYIKANYEHGYMHVLHLLQIFIMPDVLSCAVDHMIRQCCDCVVTWEGSMDRGTGVQLRSLRTVLFLQCTITIFRCTFCASVTLWVHRNTQKNKYYYVQSLIGSAHMTYVDIMLMQQIQHTFRPLSLHPLFFL